MKDKITLKELTMYFIKLFDFRYLSLDRNGIMLSIEKPRWAGFWVFDDHENDHIVMVNSRPENPFPIPKNLDLSQFTFQEGIVNYRECLMDVYEIFAWPVEMALEDVLKRIRSGFHDYLSNTVPLESIGFNDL